MASYKVPQDVEADDKLIGPFSFRQFIYLIVVVMAGAMAWGLAQIFIGLAIIPLPVMLLFGALALPLRKDQPMETYLAAIVSFYLKPRKRIWDPEGVESNITITAPKTVEVSRVKNLSEGEAVERLSYLANLVDTQGWSIRGVMPNQNLSMNSDVVLEAQGAEDILDENTSVANTFDQMMAASTQRMREEAKENMFAATAPPVPLTYVPPAQEQAVTQQYAMDAAQSAVNAAYTTPAPQPAPTTTATPVFNPYPTINQSVIQPLGADDRITQDLPEYDVQPTPEQEQPQKSEPEPASTSETVPSADIIELANNADLSIETIAHEANRLKKKAEEDTGEVVISLR